MSENEIKMTQEEFEILDRILSGLLHGAERLAVIAAIDKEGFSRNTPPKEENKPFIDSIDLWEEIAKTCSLRGITLSRGTISIIRDAIIHKFALPAQREVKWPEKVDLTGFKDGYGKGSTEHIIQVTRNSAIDDCNKAYEEAQPNQCLDEIESMNPPLEMDVEAMAKELLIFECDMTWDSLEESTKTFYRTQAIYLIANSHKWIKEKGK